jgi:predicted dinucleotide-binding enzyme
MKVGVIGSGQVGQTLASGLAAAGHDVRIASRDPDKLAAFAEKSGIHTATPSSVATWAELIVLAVLGRAAKAALDECGGAALDGKVVIDTTNPIAHEPPDHGVVRYFTGPNDSLMEQLQRAYPTARFVKAFNSVGSALMVHPSFPAGTPTMFYCGNDAAAKAVVAGVLEQLGWQPADMGGAASARAIEPLCQLWCIPGFLENRWNDHVFAMLQR